MTLPPTIRAGRRAAPLAPILGLAAALAAVGLGGMSPALAAGPLDRAQQAEARGDLKTAQIELRNAVRASPDAGVARAALATVSLDLGDTETAEREARAALERGFDPVAGTALLLRVYLAQGRFVDLLRDFSDPAEPVPQPGVPGGGPGGGLVGGQVAAARALAQIALNQLDAARQSAATARHLAPAAVEPFYAAAGLALAEGNRAAAEAAVDQALAIAPAAPEALIRKGSLVLARGEARAAAELFGQVIAHAPGNVAARLRRAEVLLQLREDTAARQDVEALTRAAALAPGDAAIMARLAAARLVIGDAAGTTTAAEAALQLQPGQAGAREMLAVAAMARGDLAAMVSQLDQMDPAVRRGEVAVVLEGTLHMMRLAFPAARTSFETALRDHPDSISARLGLAREAAQAAAPSEPTLAVAVANILIRVGEAARAVTMLEAEALRGRRGAALPFTRAEAHSAAGQWAEAQAASRAALAEEPDSTPARRQLASLLVRAGDSRTAEAVVHEGLRERPADAPLQQMLVALALQARGLDAALEVADRLAQQVAAQPTSRLLRGDLLANAQRFEESARAYAAASAEAPSSTLAQRQAAAWRAANRPAEAVAALAAWLEREPTDIAALATLAQFDIQAGRLADAERRLASVVAAAPGHIVALNNLAWLLGERGGAEAIGRGRELAERAYFLAPTADTADTLGWILARNGEPGRALPLLRQAVAAPRATPAADPGMTYRLAFTLGATGEREEALRVLGPVLAAAAAFPERADAERLLADLRAGR